MLPMNPRELQKQLKQLKKLGVKIEQIEDVKGASIELSNRKLILYNPEVFVIEFGGQKMFYIITQNVREETETAQKLTEASSLSISISDEDIRFVAEYTGVPLEKARDAIVKAGGDIAKAIELIEKEKSLAQ